MIAAPEIRAEGGGQLAVREELALSPEQIRRRVDPDALPFETTEEVAPLVGTIGQPRALAALEFGLDVETPGFNVFVAGAPGSGRFTTAHDLVERLAAARAQPNDWVYVHDFALPDRPVALALPAGRGRALERDMREFVRSARREIARAFESEEYARRQHELAAEMTRRREDLVADLVAFARAREFAIDVTPAGVVSGPLVEGKPVTTEAFEALPTATREAINRRAAEINEATAAYAARLHELEKEAAERLRAVQRDVALFAVGPLLRDLRARYDGLPAVLAYLDAVESDVVLHVDDFRQGEEDPEPLPMLLAGRRPDFWRYEVNVLVDNSALRGAPVVVERNPTYYHLLGRVDYRPSFGAMVTDFREIKAGALHRANGGFLLLEALDLFRHPFAWDALKRALHGREARIEDLGQEFSSFPTSGLRPEPIPLDVKVVLIGPPIVYRLLYLLDEEFRELFKVKADFALDMEWDGEADAGYAGFASRYARDAGLRHLDRAAVARLIELGGRLAEDQRKVSTRLIEIADAISEASHWAGVAGREVATAEDVDRAVSEREYRSNLVEERVREWTANGTIMIDTSGARVGTLNGISIVELGDSRFGRPVRITARVAPGRAGPRSIEREIELSGPIHSKGFLVLAGYVAGTYGADDPLALSATVTFEQSYDEVDGDSASSAELYALLSALSGLPVAQGIAATGSVNQNGEVQAVGGVTRKIEGFYATCKAAGLTGEQGVIVPASNVRNLMLADEVADAVRDGRFHVWAVRTIDEGIELLTGAPAGRPGADGTYPAGTVHALVQARLRAYVARLHELDGDRGGPSSEAVRSRGRHDASKRASRARRR
jgi:predicted ATP-dependent protease